MRPATVVRLAFAGTRTDTVRVGLTAASGVLATVVMLLAATVLAIATPGAPGDTSSDTWSRQYRIELLVEPGLRKGVVIALVLLTIPVLALAGQCGRLGAPARDRRLAAIRLAGATPRQAVTLAAAETGLATALGSLLGAAVYLVGRVLLHRPDGAGKLLLPTDVLPRWWAFVAVCAGLPLLATAVAVLLLRRVAVTPFGVVRRIGTGSMSHAAGRVLHRFARRPAALLAARRLMADPWAGSRTFAVLMVCVLFGAGAAAVRAWFASDFATREDSFRWQAQAQGQPYVPGNDSFYFDSLNLVDAAVTVAMALAAAGMLVAIAEGIVARRREYAALVATGVPRGTLARATLWQVFTPVVPAVLVALAAGAALPRGIAHESHAGGGTTQYCVVDWAQCQDPGSPNLRTLDVPTFVRAIPVPFADLALVGAGALVAMLVVVGVGLLFLRRSTSIEELRTT